MGFWSRATKRMSKKSTPTPTANTPPIRASCRARDKAVRAPKEKPLARRGQEGVGGLPGLAEWARKSKAVRASSSSPTPSP